MKIHSIVLPSPIPCFHVVILLRNNFASRICYPRSNIIWFVDLIVITLLYYIKLQKSSHSVYFEKKKNNETIWNHHWLESGGKIFIAYIFVEGLMNEFSVILLQLNSIMWLYISTSYKCNGIQGTLVHTYSRTVFIICMVSMKWCSLFSIIEIIQEF